MSATLIRTRDAFTAEVKNQLAKGRSVLILGERGTGKSYTLGIIAQALPNAIYLPNVSSKKAALMSITERLFKEG
jgi:energy-coupling factor transporter ATP-binding protein EcfA2